MKIVVSQRLKLIPLSLEQLYLLVKGRDYLEVALGLSKSNFEINSEFDFLKMLDDVLKAYTIPDVERNPENYEWFTHWLIIDKSQNLCIGGIGVNGLPNENGELLLGYFIDKNSEKKGFATEAVRFFSQHLFKNTTLKYILADTLTTGKASQQVLLKNGFLLRGEIEDGLRWELLNHTL
ncbi:GNAT family N-acetyltransferase [soil metagenome]